MRFTPASTRTGTFLPLAALILCAVLIAGCGKTGREQSSPSSHGGPLPKLAPVEREGAVSVTTRNTTRVGGATAAVGYRWICPASEFRPVPKGVLVPARTAPARHNLAP